MVNGQIYLGIPIIQAQLERISDADMLFCWRNLFSSICFLGSIINLIIIILGMRITSPWTNIYGVYLDWRPTPLLTYHLNNVLKRILVKVVKNKPWRAMSLVTFKSTVIFKRAMMVKHGMFQYYLLKVIKEIGTE